MPDLPGAAPILCHGLPILLRGSAMFLHDVPTGLRTGVLYELIRPAAGPYGMTRLMTAAGPYGMNLTTAAGLCVMSRTTAEGLRVMRLMTADLYVMKLMTADLFGSAARAVHSGCRGPARSAPVYQAKPSPLVRRMTHAVIIIFLYTFIVPTPYSFCLSLM